MLEKKTTSHHEKRSALDISPNTLKYQQNQLFILQETDISLNPDYSISLNHISENKYELLSISSSGVRDNLAEKNN